MSLSGYDMAKAAAAQVYAAAGLRPRDVARPSRMASGARAAGGVDLLRPQRLSTCVVR